MSTTALESILFLLALSTATGLMGCFVLMRRMVLAADALSHVALPGIGIALVLRVHPLAGALVSLVLGALLVWGIEGRALVATETVVGVVFSAALALGAMTASGDELVHALLGRPEDLALGELALALGGAAGVVAFLLLRRRELLVAIVSRDIAVSVGIRLRLLDLQFLLAFAVTIVLGLRYLGVLLMGSLVIIPAAIARQLARNLRGMLLFAIAAAAISTLAGAWIGAALGRDTGPPIVLAATTLFLASLAKGRRD